MLAWGLTKTKAEFLREQLPSELEEPFLAKMEAPAVQANIR